MYEYTIRMASGTVFGPTSPDTLRRIVAARGDIEGYLALNLLEDETVSDATFTRLTNALLVETGVTLERSVADDILTTA